MSASYHFLSCDIIFFCGPLASACILSSEGHQVSCQKVRDPAMNTGIGQKPDARWLLTHDPVVILLTMSVEDGSSKQNNDIFLTKRHTFVVFLSTLLYEDFVDNVAELITDEIRKRWEADEKYKNTDCRG
jgi:hypothetical protein